MKNSKTNFCKIAARYTYHKWTKIPLPFIKNSEYEFREGRNTEYASIWAESTELKVRNAWVQAGDEPETSYYINLLI